MSKWLSSRRQELTGAGEDVVKRECLYIVGGSVNWPTLMENNMEVSQKIQY